MVGPLSPQLGYFLGGMAKNYNYDYPRGESLRPDTKKHKKLLSMILQRVEMAHSRMTNRFDSWQGVEKTLTAYIQLDSNESRLKQMDPRKPVSMVIPFSYSILETLMTYMTTAFLEHPYFRFDYTDPDDALGVMLLEKVIEFQTRKARSGLNLMTAFRDSFKYGIGAVHPYWDVKTGTRPSRRTPTEFGTGMDRLTELGLGVGEEEVEEEFVLFEGNRMANIIPYNLLLDPNVSCNNIQDGEFVGFINRTNLASVLGRENSSGRFFNGQYMKHLSGVAPINGMQDSELDIFDVQAPFYPDDLTRPIDEYHLYIKIIPEEWPIGGNGTMPELWMFTVLGGHVVASADKLGLWHGRFPIEVASPDFDGYTPCPISRIEINHDLQVAQNYLMNTMIANQRQAVHNMIVYDPSIVNPNDMESAEAGMRVRARKKAWGSDQLKNSVFQLQVSDLTANNPAHINYLGQLFKQATGAVDNLQGLPNNIGDRVSATEARDLRTGAISRMEMAALAISMMFIEPLAEQLAFNTQQFMSEGLYVDIIGRYEEILRQELGVEKGVRVNPEDIDVNFEVTSGSGVLPTSGDAQSLMAAFQIIASDPELRQGFNIMRIFQTLARNAGFKNVHEYIKKGGGNVQANVLPNEEVMNQAEKGNIATLEEVIGQQNAGV